MLHSNNNFIILKAMNGMFILFFITSCCLHFISFADLEIVNGALDIKWDSPFAVNAPAFFSLMYGSYMGDITGDGIPEIILSGRFSSCGGNVRSNLLAYQSSQNASSSQTQPLEDTSSHMFSPRVLSTVASLDLSAAIKPVVRAKSTLKSLILSGFRQIKILKQLDNSTFDIDDDAYSSTSFGGGYQLEVADFNGDGFDDLVFGFPAYNQVLVKGLIIFTQLASNGSFVNTTASSFDSSPVFKDYGYGVYAGVLFPSSPPSLFFITQTGGKLLLNLGNGSFIVDSSQNFIGVVPGAVSCVWKDFNGDGYDDVFYSGPVVKLFQNAKNGSFIATSLVLASGPVAYSCIGTGDVELDGDLDVIISGEIIGQVGVYASSFLLNNGSGSFTEISSTALIPKRDCQALIGKIPNGQQRVLLVGPVAGSQSSISAAAFDGLDLIDTTKQTFKSNSLYMRMTETPYTVSATDVNSDGCMDLAYSSENYLTGSYYGDLMVGSCNGSFTRISNNPIVGMIKSTMIWQDFNLDGYIDLFQTGQLSCCADSAVNYRLGTASGIFEAQVLTSPIFLPAQLTLPFREPLAVSVRSSGNFCPDILFLGTNSSFNQLFAGLYQCIGNGSFLDVSSSHLLGNPPTVPYASFIAPFQPFAQNSTSTASTASTSDSDVLDAIIVFKKGYPFVQPYIYLLYYLQSHSNRSYEYLPFHSISSSSNPVLNLNVTATVSSGDFSSDGLVDILIISANENSLKSWILQNMGNRTFAQIGGNNPLVGTFETYTFAQLILSTLDYDMDGNLDVMFSYSYASLNYFFYFRNIGNLAFEDATSNLTWVSEMETSGSFVVAQFTSALDNATDFFFTGSYSCGFRMPLRRAKQQVAPQIATSSSSNPQEQSSSTGGLAGDSDNSDSLSGASIAGIVAGVAGGAGFLFIAALCFICCVLILILLLFVTMGVIGCLLCVLIMAALMVGGIMAVGVEITALRKIKSRTTSPRSDEEEESIFNALTDSDAMSAIIAQVASVDSFNILDWKDIKVIRKLGSGAFGEVLLAQWNGVEVAIKLFRNPDEEVVTNFQHEALMMAKVTHHPYMVAFIGAVVEGDFIAMVMKYYSGGSLLDALESKRLDLESKRRILTQAASALEFLHSLGIIHRDIAARNILLDGGGNAKLADLGLSRLIENGQMEQTTASYIGPVRWMSPEAITNRTYSSASDAYSFGTLITEVYGDGTIPYAELTSVADVAIAIVNQGRTPVLPPHLPVDLVPLVQHLWSRNPNERPKMAEVMAVLKKQGLPKTLTQQMEIDTTLSQTTVDSKSYQYEAFQSECE